MLLGLKCKCDHTSATTLSVRKQKGPDQKTGVYKTKRAKDVRTASAARGTVSPKQWRRRESPFHFVGSCIAGLIALSQDGRPPDCISRKDERTRQNHETSAQLAAQGKRKRTQTCEAKSVRQDGLKGAVRP